MEDKKLNCEGIFEAMPTAALMMDKEWRITHFNAAAEELTGMPRTDAIGMKAKDIFGTLGRRGDPVMAGIMKGSEVDVPKFRFTNSYDEDVVCHLKAKAKKDADGAIENVVVFLEPVRKDDHTLKVINSVQTPIIAMDRDFNITYINRPGLEMLKLPEDQVIGKKCHSILRTKYCNTDNCLIKRSFLDGKERMGDAVVSLPSGEVPIRVFTSLIRDERGEVIGATEQFFDISKELEITKEVERIAEAARQGKVKERANVDRFDNNYRKIVEGVNDVINAYLAPLLVANSYMAKLAAGEMPQKITKEYSGDFDRLKVHINETIDTINMMVSETQMLAEASAKGDFSRRADATKHKGDYAKIVGLFNDTLDLMSRKIAWYEQILDSIPFPISVTDMDMNLTFINKASEKIVKRSRAEMYGKHCSNWNGKICGTSDCGIMRLRGGNNQTFSDRGGRITQITCSYLKDLNGQNIGHIEVLQDVSAAMKPAQYNKIEVERLANNLRNLARGDLNIDRSIGEADEHTKDARENFVKIYDSVGEVTSAIEQMSKDAKMLVDAAIHGRLDTRVDASRHKGEFKAIVDGVNATLNSVVGNLEAIPTPIMFMDKDLKIQYINKTGAALLGRTKDELQNGRVRCSEVWRTSKCNTPGCPCATAMRTDDVAQTENDCVIAGNRMDIACVGAPLRDMAGNVVGSFEFVSDQTAIKKQMRVSEKQKKYLDDVVNILSEGFESLASGDMTTSIEIPRTDDKDLESSQMVMLEIGEAIEKFRQGIVELLTEVNRSVDLVSSTSQELASSAEEMNASTEQVSSAIQQISKGAQNQAAQVEDTAKIMADIASSVEVVVERSNKAMQTAQGGSKSCAEGMVTVQNTVKKMREIERSSAESANVINTLGQRSEEIGQIVDVITSISDQTNLLALNAAIEAARAGEQGRGFAVVAEEVKNLAEDSREAAERIAKIVKDVQSMTLKAVESIRSGSKEVTEGVSAAEMAGKAFEEIKGGVDNIAAMVDEIVKLMIKQKEGTQRAAKSVDGIASVAEETASASEESASSTEELTASMEDMTARAQSLSEMAINLKRITSKFKLAEEEQEIASLKQSSMRAKAEKGRQTKKEDLKVPAKVRESLEKRGLIQS
ncbi:MAG: PAS domain-containing protein [Methanomassiliicoccales archaeon]|nr:MAG: PAS domain-containing protein [Methanomassiliicoccales archaeon]